MVTKKIKSTEKIKQKNFHLKHEECNEENTSNLKETNNSIIKNALPIRSKSFNGFDEGKYSGKIVKGKEVFSDINNENSVQENNLKYEENIHQKLLNAHLDQIDSNNLEESIASQTDDEMSEDAQEIEKIRNKISDNDLLEEGEMIGNITERREIEARKAKHVLRQKLLWENMLRIRVSLQRPLDIVNILPNNSISKKDEELGVQLRSTLFHLISLQNSLLNSYKTGCKSNNSSISLGIEDTKDLNENYIRSINKNSEMTENMDTIWNLVKHSYQRWKILREKSINLWSRKTQLTSSSSLKSINSDATDQVQRQLKQMHKLVKDTQIWRGTESLLGKRKRIQDENSHITFDLGIYDDRDFYQTLLTNLLQDASSSQSNEIEKSKSAKRQRVNKPITRDRTIKYITIPELVGFMAPQPRKIPQSSRALFNNLFGRKRCEDNINEFEYISDEDAMED